MSRESTRRVTISARYQTCGCFLLFVAFCLASTGWGDGKDSQMEAPGRLVRVDDAITMNRLADTIYSAGGSSRGRVAQFSPNGKRFVVVVKGGNLVRNTNDYSVLLFDATPSGRSGAPKPLLTMSSLSNDPAVRDVKWLGDNQSIVFIGEREGALPQIYSLNTLTGKFSAMTHEPRSVRSFDVSLDGLVLLFTEDRAPITSGLRAVEAGTGIVVSKQSILNLLDLSCPVQRLLPEQEKDLFLQIGRGNARKIPVDDALLDYSPVSLSSDGAYGLIRTYVRHVPAEWEEYKVAFVRQNTRNRLTDAGISILSRYIVLDTKSRAISTPIDAPSEPHQDGFAWAPDGKSVVISGIFLPLDVHVPAEREEREHSTYVIEMQPRSGALTKIARCDAKISSWNRNSGRVLLESAYWWKDEPPTVYEKSGTAWRQTPVTISDLAGNAPFRIELSEGMNSPPEVVGFDPRANRKFVIFDLNPQLSSVALAKVEYVRWRAKDGHDVEGGVYFPSDYKDGVRYPLVIQTHGFTRDRFWIDGPFTSVFAAQALAARGIMVLQMGGSPNFDDFEYLNSTQEAPRQMAAYEGAIDYLDQRGWIDRSKVGLVGFSRTVFAVEYTLTHSSYPIAAAVIADGFDGGYLQYLVFRDVADYADVNGGPAIGKSLAGWIERSPGFNLDHVHTPVRIETYGAGSLFAGWEWFIGLTRLKKPVEYVYYPNASHTLVKPQDRHKSLEGTVDWFRYWLKDESNPKKRDQDLRWRELRTLQEQRETGDQTVDPPPSR